MALSTLISWATITTIHFQNFFIIPNRNSVPIHHLTKLGANSSLSPVLGDFYATFCLFIILNTESGQRCPKMFSNCLKQQKISV